MHHVKSKHEVSGSPSNGRMEFKLRHDQVRKVYEQRTLSQSPQSCCQSHECRLRDRRATMRQRQSSSVGFESEQQRRCVLWNL